MEIIDITRELFSAPVYPGDPVPAKEQVLGFQKETPDVCQLTALSLGSHSGTHVDAPLHFIPGGKSCAEVDLQHCLGPCRVVTPESAGRLSPDQIDRWTADGTRRLLIRGDIEITPEAAAQMVKDRLLTIGVEQMTVGSGENGPVVHRTLLGAEVLIIENLDLSNAADGIYMLSALPLRMAELDGSPVRAVLFRMEEADPLPAPVNSRVSASDSL